MLSQVAIFRNVIRDSGFWRTEKDTSKGEAGDVLENAGVLDGFSGSFAPGERGVAGHEHAGDGQHDWRSGVARELTMR